MRPSICVLLILGLAACGPSKSQTPPPPRSTADGGTNGGTTGGGGTDGGTTDGGTRDGGTSDPGTTDGGTGDPGATDGGTGDPGSTDGGTSDPGTTDPGTTDPGTTDGGTSDPGTTDPGTTDPGTTDGGTSDPGATTATIVWQRSFPRPALVGSDWDGKVAASEGPVLMTLAPETGATTASHDFTEDFNPGNAFQDRLGIAPGSSTIWGTIQTGVDWQAARSLCDFDLSGSEHCVQGALDTVHLTPMTMSADGSVGWGTGPFVVNASVIDPAGVERTIELWSTNVYDGTELIGVAREPNGDMVVAVHAGTAFEVDGQAMGPSDALFRIDPEGHLVWWHAVPFTLLDFGLSSAGTVVCVGTSASAFTWGGESVSGTALVVVDADGTERFARQLVDSVASSAFVSVLPLGRVAITLNRPGCGGAAVFRYDLAGAQTWHWDLAAHGCDVAVSSVSILPENVLVAGSVSAPTDLGGGPLEEGGFVLELAPNP